LRSVCFCCVDCVGAGQSACGAPDGHAPPRNRNLVCNTSFYSIDDFRPFDADEILLRVLNRVTEGLYEAHLRSQLSLLLTGMSVHHRHSVTVGNDVSEVECLSRFVGDDVTASLLVSVQSLAPFSAAPTDARLCHTAHAAAHSFCHTSIQSSVAVLRAGATGQRVLDNLCLLLNAIKALGVLFGSMHVWESLIMVGTLQTSAHS
jgi:hypothetical protein